MPPNIVVFRCRKQDRSWENVVVAASHESMNLLEEISEFCKAENIAESTFGKRAVNDGKFVSRLKDGARVTPETWVRVAGYLEKHGWQPLQQPEPGSLHLIPVNRQSSATDQAATENLRWFPGGEFPFLRQSLEISVIRQHL